ncbi:MAG: amidohydrolase family protein [Rhodobacteraceae bacterium]|nr:amidohydrolase family protein [Paracoccaceae bacterium]
MTRFIDAHHHVWDPATAHYPWMTDALAPIRRRFDTDDLRAAIGPAGVTGTVLVQTRSSLEESSEFLALAAATDCILGVVAWVDLTAPGVEDDIRALKAGPGGQFLVGIRHLVHDEPDPEWLLRGDVARGLQAVARQDLVYDLLLRPRELPAAIRAVQQLPALRWVVDHIAKPEIARRGWDPWAGGIAALAAASSTCHVKLSGMVTEADWQGWTPADLVPYAHHALDCFGPSRTMLGSDWPVCLLAGSYQRVMDTARGLIAHLPPDAQDQILWRTAATVYRLTP